MGQARPSQPEVIRLSAFQSFKILALPSSHTEHRQLFQKIAGLFGLASALLVVIGTISYRSTFRLIETSGQTERTRQTLQIIEQVISDLKDVETSRRGYFITGEKSYLKPYQDALEDLERKIKDLQKLLASEPTQSQKIATVQSLIRRNLAIIGDTNRLSDYGEPEAEIRLIGSNHSKRLMNDIRQLAYTIQDHQQKRLSQFQQQSQKAKASAKKVIPAFGLAILLSFLVIALVYYLICREVEDRQQAEAILEQERDFISAVLDTVGSLVVVLNSQGKIVRSNQACEQTIHGTFEDMRERYFWDVFALPENATQVQTDFEELLNTRIPTRLESILIATDGQRHFIDWSSTILLNATGVVAYVISTGTDITERKWVEEETQLLQTTIQAISEAKDFDAALKIALAHVCEATGWSYGEAWIPCADRAVLNCRQTWYDRPEQNSAVSHALAQFHRLSEHYTFALGDGLPGRVWASKRSEWIQDVSLMPDTMFVRVEAARQAGLKAGLSTPIIANTQVLAVLVFFMLKSRPENKRLVQLVSTVATQLGSAIQRKRVEAELNESEERFRLLVEGVKDYAILMLDASGHITSWNTGAERIEGYRSEEILGQHFSRFHPPQDIQAGKPEQELKIAAATGQFEEEGWRVRKDGSRFWATVVLTALWDAHGRLRGFSSVTRDITERKLARDALQQANTKLQNWVSELEQHNREISLLGEMSDVLQACLTIEEAYSALPRLVQPLFPNLSGGIFTISASQKLVEAVAIWGGPMASQKVFTPNECWALRRGRAHLVTDAHSGLCCSHLHNPQPVASICVPMMARGEALGLLYFNSQNPGPLSSAQQQLAVTVAEQIALALANLKLHETLQYQSVRDPLTGLFNRRYMEESLEREIHRAQRKQQSLGIIMLDVDHFKRFNDTFGHDAGDEVLRELGLFLRKQTRVSDIACRYGGEELTLILPDASLEAAYKRAEQLREGVKQLQVRHHQVLGVITLSLGVASSPEHGLTNEAVIQAADAALYQAKAEGRDRVVIAPLPPVA